MPFPIENQQDTEWCWAAVSVSLEHYFNPDSQLTQLQFVQRLIPPAEAAAQGLDVPFDLQVALSSLGLQKGQPLPAFLPFSQIQQQLDLNLPVCVEIEWYGEDIFHYLVLTGYGVSPAGDVQVYVADPMLSDYTITPWDYNSFVYAYSPSYASAEGEWVETFFVQPTGGSQ